MNFSELLKQGSKILEVSGIDDFDFDAMCLLEYAFDFGRNSYFLNRYETVDESNQEKFLSLINRRADGEPLQYIIGKWGFMDGEFYVGEGVLIPRADTEILVETAADFICKNKVETVFDLCAGSGCIGISLGMMFPDIKVVCAELSDKAFSYLEKNIELNKVKNVTAVKCDITKDYVSFDLGRIDVLVSNPPYIETDEITTLSKEVRQEPFMALDGGKDGFDFYRIIGEKWISQMKKDSFCAFECGETQAKELSRIYSEYSSSISIINDLNGIERVVSLIKN